MSTRTPENKAMRLCLASRILAGNALELPETVKDAARVLGIPEDQYRGEKDWPRVVSKMALEMADAVLAEAEATETQIAPKRPAMDATSAEELRRIAQQANALWRRNGRIRTAEMSDIARFLAHWSRSVQVALYGRDGMEDGHEL